MAESLRRTVWAAGDASRRRGWWWEVVPARRRARRSNIWQEIRDGEGECAAVAISVASSAATIISLVFALGDSTFARPRRSGAARIRSRVWMGGSGVSGRPLNQPPPASFALDGAAQTSICTLFTYVEMVHTMPAGQSESLTQSCCCPLMHALPSWHTPPPGPNGKPGGPPAPPMQQTCPEPQLPGALH
jgi:hypothetical protein